MVSFQPPLSPDQRKVTVSATIPNFESTSSHKRKWNDQVPDGADYVHEKRWNPKSSCCKLFSDLDLHLETPLPSEWQRCLDIQSGEIHFYNTRTHKRTLTYPRENEPPHPSSPLQQHMSLDLELNLPCGFSNFPSETKNLKKHASASPSNKSSTDYLFMRLTTTVEESSSKKARSKPPSPQTSSLSLKFTDSRELQQEMVAACMRCHMLVMLCKSSPECPNCKFMHSPDQGPPSLFKPRLSLLC